MTLKGDIESNKTIKTSKLHFSQTEKLTRKKKKTTSKEMTELIYIMYQMDQLILTEHFIPQ